MSASLKRLSFLVAVAVSCSALSGCSEAWRKKFIRKRKAPRTQQAILVLQPDYQAVMPAADRYREHFAFWRSWHSELLTSFGEGKKRDLAQLQGAIGELRSMQALLTGEPADRLTEILADMEEMAGRWETSPAASPPASDRTALQQIEREVGKRYHYSNIRETVVAEPEREEESPPSPPA